MQLPFTEHEFLEVLAAYNEAVWPMQWILYGLAFIGLAALFFRLQVHHRTICGILAFFWVWMAIAYHFGHFTAINSAAWLFGALYLVQAALLVWLGIIRDNLKFGFSSRRRVVVAGVLFFYGLVAYPLLGKLLAHSYPELPTFGLPCPTTIFTIGFLFLLVPPFPRRVLVVPILWSAVGGSAAFSLGIWQDLGLLAAGLCALVLLVLPQRASSAGRAGPLAL
jgi:hypothetical protein